MAAAQSRAEATNHIAKLRKEKGLSQAELAEKVGSHWITISKLERGIMQFTDSWRERIATALEVDPWDLVVGARKLPPIHVLGRLFEGGEIDDIADENLVIEINTQFFVHPDFRWVQVGDNSLYPWYQPGDIICLMALEEEEVGEHVGRVCVAFFVAENGEADHAVGVLENGSSANTVNVQRFGKPTLRDVKLTDLWVLVMAIFDVAKSRP